MVVNVFVEELSDKLKATEPSRREILRYMQSGECSDDFDVIVEQCVRESEELISARVCFAEFDVRFVPNETDTLYIGDLKVCSRDLSRNLSGCDKAIIFAATVGLNIDRAMAKHSLISPAKALCIGAVGNERVETLCDIFYDLLKKRYGRTRPRFSPGYGDLPLALQKNIFGLLDCPKNIGAFLSDSMLITPSKSVTAIVGVESGD